MAWFHHRGRNPHHYEMWIDNFDNGGIALEMPKKYVYEMVCDYIGAAKAYMGDKFTWKGEYEWWLKKKQNAKMHENTIKFLDYVFGEMAEFSDNPNPDLYFSKDFLDDIWRTIHSV